MSTDLRALRPIADELAGVVGAFAAGGFELYLVGGLVRDVVANVPTDVADVDLATDAEPDQIRRLLADRADSMWSQGERFGTIGVELGERKIEITTFRAEVYRSESRKPKVRYSSELRTDLSRRDFTINALAVSLPGLVLVDPFDGVGDLERRILRTPLEAATSFDDDPLRMLRAARFVASLGLTPVDDLVAAMRERVDRLVIVSDERVGDEVLKLLSVASPGRGFDVLEQGGLLGVVIPRYELTPPEDRALDASMIDLVPADAILRLGALCTFSVASAASVVGSGLRLSRDHTRRIGELGGAITAATRLVEADPATARRIALALGADMFAPGTVLRARAQALGDHDRPDEAARMRLAADSLDRSWSLIASEDLSRLGPELTATEVMEELAIEPGPDVGTAMGWLRNLRLDEGPLGYSEASRRLRAWWGGR